jgi:hypothetical protein
MTSKQDKDHSAQVTALQTYLEDELRGDSELMLRIARDPRFSLLTEKEILEEVAAVAQDLAENPR